MGSLIDHDVTIDEYCHINTGAIVKANFRVMSYAKIDAGEIFAEKQFNQEYSFETGGTIMVYLKIKRLIDIILSTLGLIILSPVFLVFIITIKLGSPGSVLFKQKRVGIHKNHFNILKFRTMRIDTPNNTPTHLLEYPDQWITKVGKFLRRTSLDELLQIINIYKGELSIIGKSDIVVSTKEKSSVYAG